MGARLRVSGFCLKPAYLKEVFCYVPNAPTNQKWLDTNHFKKSNKMAWNIMKMKAKRRAAHFQGLVVMALSLRINEAESASSGPDLTRECGRRDPRSHARGAFKPFLYKCSGPHTVTESLPSSSVCSSGTWKSHRHSPASRSSIDRKLVWSEELVSQSI